MKYLKTLFLFISFSQIFFSQSIFSAEDTVELETTFIKGNKELPQILYIVPWQDMKQKKSKQDIIVLHSLFGDTFDPVTPKKLTQ